MYLFIINNYYLKELFLQISYYALQFSQVKFFSFCVLHQTEYNISHDNTFNIYLFIFLSFNSNLTLEEEKKKARNEFSFLALFLDNNYKV